MKDTIFLTPEAYMFFIAGNWSSSPYFKDKIVRQKEKLSKIDQTPCPACKKYPCECTPNDIDFYKELVQQYPFLKNYVKTEDEQDEAPG